MGGSHREYWGLNGYLENTFGEWKASDFDKNGVDCQLCHMPSVAGIAAVGGPPRRIHDHRFMGVDYATVPYLDVDVSAQKEEIVRLLRGSVSFFAREVPERVISGTTFSFNAWVRNAGAGHSGLVKSRYRWAGSGPESAKAGVRKAGDQVEAAARRHLGPVRGA